MYGCYATENLRKSLIGKIHVAKSQLAMSDSSYRTLMERITGQPSCAQVRDLRKLDAVLKEMRRLGFVPKPARKSGKRPNPAKGRQPLINKIEAQLTEAKRPWSYADALAKRMFGIDKVEWLECDQLRSLVAALAIDARRHGRPV